MRTLSFVRDLFRKFPSLLVTSTVLVAVVNVLDAASILTVAPVADLILHPDLQGVSPITSRFLSLLRAAGLPVTLLCLLTIFFLLYTVMNGCQILLRHWIIKTKYAVLRDMYLGTFRDFFAARWYFFTSGKQGTLLSTFTREITMVGEAFSAMALFFASLVQILLYLAVPFYLSWKITSVCLAATIAFAWPFILLGKTSYRLGRQNTATANEIWKVIQESLNMTKVILGFGNQGRSLDALGRAFDTHFAATIKSTTLGIAIPLMYQPLGILVLGIALLSASRAGLPLSETAVILFALLKIIPAVGQIAYQRNSLDNFFPSFEQISSLRGRARELAQPSGSKPFPGLRQGLTLDAVSFAYPGHEPTLQDVTLRVPKGKMVALVGESGAGKSTLIDIVMGFNEPDRGTLSCDGVPLSEFDINSYRKRIGYVPQESVLFHGTVRENLLWAKDDAGEEDILAACRKANADEFVSQLPQGYETVVGDRGVRLSGGQIQRIALARAMLRKPELLILDEATSALDTHSERLIQQAIEAISREATIIVIAHRLSTIVNADRVYVLKKGRVIEEGSYAELVKKDGQFNRMARLQVLEAAKGEQA